MWLEGQISYYQHSENLAETQTDWTRTLASTFTHLWLNDSKQVFPEGHLLGEAVVVFGMEGNAKEAHDAGMGGEG